MDHPAVPYTKANRQSATFFCKSRVKSTLELAKKLSTDPDKIARLKAQQCLACFYFSRMAGQAFTDQPCGKCGKPETYSSTATDVLCMECAQEEKACKKCGGDLKLVLTQRILYEIS